MESWCVQRLYRRKPVSDGRLAHVLHVLGERSQSRKSKLAIFAAYALWFIGEKGHKGVFVMLLLWLCDSVSIRFFEVVMGSLVHSTAIVATISLPSFEADLVAEVWTYTEVPTFNFEVGRLVLPWHLRESHLDAVSVLNLRIGPAFL